ncbi:MAG: DUF4105 domain-containing protein [Gemmatimonadota bacterium]
MPAAAAGQAPPDTARGSELTVTLLTFGVGAIIWERFGHNALWIHDEKNGTDQAYDYGRFDFRQKNFFLHFAQGRNWYSMGAGPVQAYLASYRQAERTTWAQELDLPPAARADLRDFLVWNDRPENRAYYYDYYRDNCSTRIRDALDKVLGGQIKRYGDSVRTDVTYRSETRRLTENSVLMHTLLMIGLGSPTDHRLSASEQMFLPIELRPHLDRITVTDPDGRVHPLVKREAVIYQSNRFQVSDRPANWTPWYCLAGLLLGVALWRGGVGGGRVFWWSATTWTIVAGLFGTALAALWGFTDHRVAYWNENLFQLNLLSVALAVLLPSARRDARRRRLALGLAGLVAGVALLGLAVTVLPGFIQSNYDVIGLVLPIHLGLFVGLKGAVARAGAAETAMPSRRAA